MTLRHILTTLLGAATLAASAFTVSVDTKGGRRVRVDVLTDNILRVTNLGPGESVPVSRASVLDSLATSGTASSMTTTDNSAFFTTATGVSCAIDPSGTVTLSAGPDRIVTDNGVRVSADGRQTMQLFTTSPGSFYGAGERGHSYNLRGDTLVNYNRQNYGYTGSDPRIDQMNITMPLFLSSDGFAIVFDDFARSEMVLGNPIVYTTVGRQPISYYFVNSKGTLADLTRELTALTGRQQLAPFWSLGYITSKYGYHDRAETIGTIDTLKRNGYPVDGIVLDLYWYGKEQDMGRLAWDPQQWPDHQGMLRQLKDRGVNLVAISQPYVLRNGRGIDNYNMGDKQKLFLLDSLGNTKEVTIWVGEGGMWDVSNPDTRAWLRQRYKELTDGGITGWWGDLGEPEVHPWGIHANGLTNEEYHNQYGNDWSQIIYDLFAEDYPDTRLMTMMRGGTTGLQRYSVYPWSTDVSRSWGGLEPQVVIMLNSGLSGLGYMGHDVGGFAVDPDNAYDPELYLRWLQLGTFSPILRTHAQYKAEPYNYPQYGSAILDLIRERYRWLPYNYTLAYENAVNGWPLVRPLDFHCGHASGQFDDIRDEYLWGKDVLVAPVMRQGAVSRPVTFTCGTWYDYNDPTRTYAGHSTIEYPAPPEVLPLFVRMGAFIPQADGSMANTGDYNPGQLTVKHYLNDKGSSEYTLYDDDRMSARSIADRQYRLITFKAAAAKEAGQPYTISISSEGSYQGAPASTTYRFEVFGCKARPKTVKAGDKKVKFVYDAARCCLTFTVKNDNIITIEM